MTLRGKISYAQMQGPRSSQEDFLVHIPFYSQVNRCGHLIGVMDGHGGKEVAKYCEEAIPQIFDSDALNIRQELRRVAEKLDDHTAFSKAGSTLSIAVINESNGIVITAVIGDSPIIVVNDSGNIWLSDEHNVRTNIPEREAAIRRGAKYDGGYIYDSYNPLGDQIQMSRALGDCNLRKILDRTPTVNRQYINSRSLIIVGSDGLFDPNHKQSRESSAQSVVTLVQSGGNAAQILQFRESQGLEDNTSIIMWRPKKWWEWF